jgi:hypothetical protein
MSKTEIKEEEARLIDKKEESQEELWEELGEMVRSHEWFAGDLYNYMKSRYVLTRKEIK